MTMTSSGLEIKEELEWFSSWRTVESKNRMTELADVGLCINEHGHNVLTVDGELDEDSTWCHVNSPVGVILALKMTTLSQPKQMRYFGFTKVIINKRNEEGWLCQHSTEAKRDNPKHNIGTYMQMFAAGEGAQQTYHIQMTPVRPLTALEFGANAEEAVRTTNDQIALD